MNMAAKSRLLRCLCSEMPVMSPHVSLNKILTF